MEDHLVGLQETKEKKSISYAYIILLMTQFLQLMSKQRSFIEEALNEICAAQNDRNTVYGRLENEIVKLRKEINQIEQQCYSDKSSQQDPVLFSEMNDRNK